MAKLVNKDAEVNNPCLKEQEMSYNCLNKNGFDQSKCETHFDNYKNCKSFWFMVQKARRLKGIHPFLPPIDERAKLKEEYMKHLNKSGSTQASV